MGKLSQSLRTGLCNLALLVGTGLPAQAAPAALNGNACFVEYLARGTYITQTSGKIGTISAYANEPVVGKKYKTTIYKLNQRWYVTSEKDVAVSGEDAGGIVC